MLKQGKLSRTFFILTLLMALVTVPVFWFLMSMFGQERAPLTGEGSDTTYEAGLHVVALNSADAVTPDGLDFWVEDSLGRAVPLTPLQADDPLQEQLTDVKGLYRFELEEGDEYKFHWKSESEESPQLLLIRVQELSVRDQFIVTSIIALVPISLTLFFLIAGLYYRRKEAD